MFAHDLEAIDKLRADAVTALEPHVSGIRKLAAYAAQLIWIGGKFPIDVSGSSFRALPGSIVLKRWSEVQTGQRC